MYSENLIVITHYTLLSNTKLHIIFDTSKYRAKNIHKVLSFFLVVEYPPEQYGVTWHF